MTQPPTPRDPYGQQSGPTPRRAAPQGPDPADAPPSPGASWPPPGHGPSWQAPPFDPPYQQAQWTAPKRSSVPLVLILVAVGLASLLVSALSAYFAFRDVFGDTFTDAGAGDCLVVTLEGDGYVSGEKVDCSDDDVYSHLVTSVVKPPVDCPIDDVVYETGTWFGFGDEVAKRTCLIPNFATGHCYRVVDDSFYVYRETACDYADFEVTYLAEASVWNCSPGEEAWTFPASSRTYCIAWR